SYPIPGTGYPNIQPNFSGVQGFPNPQNFLPQTTSQEHSLHQGGADPNSPELFKQNMQLSPDMMRHSGVGGLPLLPLPGRKRTPPLPTEEQLITQTTRGVQVLYDQLKRGQDSAAVVANLLSAERPPAHR
ncbi:hypothetical protein DFH09DRAFT_1175390, partial [Mycena vulgaris]